MPKYKVTIEARFRKTYILEAADEDEAGELADFSVAQDEAIESYYNDEIIDVSEVPNA